MRGDCAYTRPSVCEKTKMRFLKTKQAGGPVIDKNNKLIGFLSESDVLAKMIETIYYNEHISDVADLMSKDVLTVKPYDSVIELGQQMLKNKPKIYPVVDDGENLVGIISRMDVLRAIDLHLRSGYKT